MSDRQVKPHETRNQRRWRRKHTVTNAATEDADLVRDLMARNPGLKAANAQKLVQRFLTCNDREMIEWMHADLKEIGRMHESIVKTRAENEKLMQEISRDLTVGMCKFFPGMDYEVDESAVFKGVHRSTKTAWESTMEACGGDLPAGGTLDPSFPK